jgi:hypothetical protein
MGHFIDRLENHTLRRVDYKSLNRDEIQTAAV